MAPWNRPMTTPDPASLLELSPIAMECAVICMRPGLRTDSLMSLGFLEVVSVDQKSADEWSAHAWPIAANALLVIACQGDDALMLKEMCHLLSENETSPTLVAVLIPQEAASDDSNDILDFALDDMLLEHGCDDVMKLEVGEKVTSARVRTAMLRADKMSQKSQALVGQVQAKARHALQVANRRFLWNLPGSTLENIPTLDRTLEELLPPGDGSDVLGGVGDCQFAAVLGEGSFGVVYQCEHPARGRLAIKVIPKETVKGAQGLFSLDREFCIMCNLPPDPHVVQAFEVLHGRTNLYLVMRFAGKKALHDHHLRVIQEYGLTSLPAGVVHDFCRQELLAVLHLHRNKICHRDLKPANFILSDDDKCLQLADFGLAMLVCGPGQLLGEACGSLPFVAPEILETRTTGRRYDGFQADCWSLAVNFFELLGGPFSVEKILRWVPKAPPSIESKIRDLKTLQAKAAESLPGSANGSLRKATMGMFEVVAQERWSAEAALGPQGLDTQITPSESASSGDSSQLQRRGRRATHAMSYVNQKGVASRALLAEMLKDLERSNQPQGCPFAHSRADVMSAFSGLPAKILADPLLAPFHEAASIKRSACGIVMSLYPQVSGDNEEERRNKLRSIHAQMEIKDIHYDALLKLVRDTFVEVGLADELSKEAMDKIEKLRGDIVMGGN